MNKTEQAIVENVEKLSEAQQEQVLAYVQQLRKTNVQPMAGDAVIALVRGLNFDPQDVDAMAQAIEEGCEQIESDDDYAL